MLEPARRWWIVAPSRRGQWVAVVLADLAIGVASAFAFLTVFGVYVRYNTYPGQCWTEFGLRINCSLEGPINAAALVTLLLLPIGLLLMQKRLAPR